MTKAELIKSIDSAIERHGIKPTVFGRRAVGDPSFVFRLRESGNPTLRTIAKIQHYITELDQGVTQ